ncbi:MAG: carbohydrate binding family 9 domain-containing protein [Enterobacterales bacterium]|nr:carbohydrate binding family 9 domain-containing protein [Enterobacterales bacterium]
MTITSVAKVCHFSKTILTRCLITGILVFFGVSPALAESPLNSTSVSRTKIQYQLPHIEAKIQLDGRIDESVWKSALKISLNYETKPAENIKPMVETDVFLFEDGETLYIAFDARDDNPEQIRDFLLDRDNIWNSDFVGIKFDTFGESRKAFQFFTNARGIQADAIQEDFRGDDQTWDAIWDSAARIHTSGYQVEMAIPFRAIRFPVSSKGQRWSFEVLRFLPRKNFHRIANSPVDRNIACSICQFDHLVGLQKVKPSKNLRLIPTLTFASSESREVDALGQLGPWQGQGADNRAGLDFRWGSPKIPT